MKIRKISASFMDERQPRAPRELSPREVARQKRERQIRELLVGLTEPEQVYLVAPTDGEKSSTIRTSLLKVAKELGREGDVIVRRHEDAWLVGISTPEREASRRGRRPKRGLILDDRPPT